KGRLCQEQSGTLPTIWNDEALADVLDERGEYSPKRQSCLLMRFTIASRAWCRKQRKCATFWRGSLKSAPRRTSLFAGPHRLGCRSATVTTSPRPRIFRYHSTGGGVG